MTILKFHAGTNKNNLVWIACGTFKANKNGAHGGVTTVDHFKTLPSEQQCKKCAAKIALLKL